MSARDKVVATIKGFSWHNYRLDEVGEAASDDWAHALADDVMAALDPEPFHTMDVGSHGWTLKHPLDCRDDLFNCPTNRAAEDLDGPPAEPGRYRVTLVEGLLVIGGPVPVEGAGSSSGGTRDER